MIIWQRKNNQVHKLEGEVKGERNRGRIFAEHRVQCAAQSHDPEIITRPQRGDCLTNWDTQVPHPRPYTNF